MLFIFFYSVIGVYGAFYKEHYTDVCNCNTTDWTMGSRGQGCPADWNPCPLLATTGEASLVAHMLGKHTYAAIDTFMALIMISASMSTLDSTFTSAAKLVSLEFGGWLKLEGDTRSYFGPLRPVDLDHIGSQHIALARTVMIIIAFVSTAFLGIEGDVMKATTAAGSSVMGIGAPIWFMTVWKVKKAGKSGWHQAPLAFLVPYVVGFFIGLSYWVHGNNKEGWTYDWKVGSSEELPTGFHYSRFLGTNLYGHLICIGLFFVFFGIHQLPFVAKYFPEVEPEDEEETIIASKVQSLEAEKHPTVLDSVAQKDISDEKKPPSTSI